MAAVSTRAYIVSPPDAFLPLKRFPPACHIRTKSALTDRGGPGRYATGQAQPDSPDPLFPALTITKQAKFLGDRI
jgi:hypothetical protein